MNEDAKAANARAKAAKAEAKALRPFWKKKRWWLVGGVGAIILISVASSGGNDSNESTTTGQADNTESSSSDTIGKGLGSKDASSDIVSVNCGTPDALGFRYPSVTVKNNSSKASTYFITIVAESSDGSIRYDDTIISIDALQPNQTTTADGLPFTEEIPAEGICKITEVQRTAS